MSLTALGSIPSLIDINVAAAGALGFLNPLAAQVDAVVAFGFGPLQASLAAQLQASLSLGAELSGLVNPAARLQAILGALAQLQAAIQAALQLPAPEISLQLSAALDAAAIIEVQLGLLQALIKASLRVKIPAVTFAADLAANLSAGPITLFAFGDPLPPGMPLAAVGSEIQAAFANPAGIDGGILPTDNVAGLLLVTKTPSAFAGIRATMKTSP